MTDTPADTLSREITSVTAKVDRWQGYLRTRDMGPGMQMSIDIMQAGIERAVAAIASGDVDEMIAAHKALRGYSDDT